ncbi:MAG: regulatory protein RecX [Ginsengibacter sp.]
MKTGAISKEKAILKIRQFCAYQERCDSEVREKLNSMDITGIQADKIVADLVRGSYLNDERFATHFAGSKFRLKKWGRIKIRYALQVKKIHAEMIKNAVDKIDESEYLKTLSRLSDQKIVSLKSEKNSTQKKRKLKDYLLQKGYEHRLIEMQFSKIKMFPGR